VLVNQAGNVTITGTIFDNVHGFVDVRTLTPLLLSQLDLFPSNGQILLTGNATAIVVTAISSALVQLQFDTNGDNIGDGFTAVMSWTDLAGPIGVDIGDTDNDGMHNSWETFYGLNPGNAADATADNDGSEGDNLSEYQNGRNPNVAGF
jgi:hypothetical protein